MVKLLCKIHATADAKRVCHQGKNSHPKAFKNALEDFRVIHNAKKEELASAIKDNKNTRYVHLEMGRLKQVRYPWVPQEFLYRSELAIEEANKKLRQCSNALEIRESPVKGQNKRIPLWETSDYLGMFASKDIKSGERIFRSKGPLAACCTKEMAVDTATNVLLSFHHGPLCILLDVVRQ